MKKSVAILLFFTLLSKSQAQSGFEIYLLDEIYYKRFSRCHHCFKPKHSDIRKTPILTESEIDYFEWETQQIHLNQSGRDSISKINIPLTGQAAAVVLKGEVIYGLWFWNGSSSFGCDWVCVFPRFDFKIRHGLPSTYAKGRDPRYDEELAEYVISNLKKN